jgi:hypothetical protein
VAHAVAVAELSFVLVLYANLRDPLLSLAGAPWRLGYFPTLPTMTKMSPVTLFKVRGVVYGNRALISSPCFRRRHGTSRTLHMNYGEVEFLW